MGCSPVWCSQSPSSLGIRVKSQAYSRYAQTAGMLFLLALLIYANSNDIYRFFIK